MPPDRPARTFATVRPAVERRSRGPLTVLQRQPRFLLAMVPAVLFAGIVVLPAVPSAVCLAVLFALVTWLGYLSWPALDGRARAIRVVVLVGLVFVGVRSVIG